MSGRERSPAPSWTVFHQDGHPAILADAWNGTTLRPEVIFKGKSEKA